MQHEGTVMYASQTIRYERFFVLYDLSLVCDCKEVIHFAGSGKMKLKDQVTADATRLLEVKVKFWGLEGAVKPLSNLVATLIGNLCLTAVF